jgi:hypothetical protein
VCALTERSHYFFSLTNCLMPRRPRRGLELKLYSFFNLGARWGVGGQRHAPAALPTGKRPCATVQEAGRAPKPVWTGAEYIAPAGIRSSDRPAHSVSLYQLSYPDPIIMIIIIIIIIIITLCGGLISNSVWSVTCKQAQVCWKPGLRQTLQEGVLANRI